MIRQLPARTYIDKLVDIYFKSFNWQYYGLDRDVFDKQLAEWYRLPFNLLTTGGPQALSSDLRAFPAMLFQTIATALLVLPSGSDPTFDSLKYAGGMTFEDLAMDYSESGVAILSLLGKRQMSITTVLAGFLRASFLKYVALVTEAVSLYTHTLSLSLFFFVFFQGLTKSVARHRLGHQGCARDWAAQGQFGSQAEER